MQYYSIIVHYIVVHYMVHSTNHHTMVHSKNSFFIVGTFTNKQDLNCKKVVI